MHGLWIVNEQETPAVPESYWQLIFRKVVGSNFLSGVDTGKLFILQYKISLLCSYKQAYLN